MLQATRFWTLSLLSLALSFPLYAREELVTLPERDGVQLTIYKEVDLTMVRERRTLSFNQGENELQFSWANTLIDPTSVHFEPVDAEAGLEIESTSFPSESNEMLRWTLFAEKAGDQQVDITYFTSGISWEASYEAVLSPQGNEMTLTGSVTVTNNSGEEYEDAQIRLIIGSVNLVEDVRDLARNGEWGVVEDAIYTLEEEMDGGYPMPSAPEAGGRGAGFAGAIDSASGRPKDVARESVGEYFMYTVEGTETISDAWSKRLVSIKEATVTTSQVYYYKPVEFGSSLVRVVEFNNDKESGLPQEPLPGGQVQFYGDAGEGRLSYIGGKFVDYVPPGEEGKWNLGVDPEVTLHFDVMKMSRENLSFQGRGRNRWLNGWDEIKENVIKVRNYGDYSVTVEVHVAFRHADYEFEETEGGEKEDADTWKWRLILDASQKEEIDYTVVFHNGVNQD